MATVKRSKEHDSEGFVGFEVTSPINLGQLEVELQEALGRTDLGLTVEGPTEASSGEPAILLVSQGESKISEIQSAINEHEPQGGWRPNPDAPVIAEIVQKAGQGEDLSPDEIQVALRYLLGVNATT
jgi:hypothetical protein